MAESSVADTKRGACKQPQLRVTVARTPSEVEAIRDPWSCLQGDRITSDLDYLLAVVRTEPGVVAPHVLLAERGGVVEALLVCRLEDVRLACRMGYKTIRLPKLRSITVVYGGLLGSDAPDVLKALLGELLRSLRAREADLAIFRELAVDSPLHDAVLRTASSIRRSHASRRSVHHELSLPDSFDEFLASLSKSTRDGVRRYRNKVNREFGDRLKVRVLREPSDIDEVMRQLELVAARSWQRGLHVGFQDDEAHRERVLLGLRSGGYRACVVSIDAEPVAFWQAHGCRGRLTSGIPGFDPAYADYRIGQYALMELIAEMCADPAIRTLDFGFGDAEYKRRFGTASWSEGTLMLFAPRFGPVAVNLTRTALAGGNEMLFAASTRLGIVGKLRSRWRRRLVAAAPASRESQEHSDAATSG